MASSGSDFVDYIVFDQMANLPITVRKMFGGFGLYYHDIFFSIIASDQIYFKTDEKTRDRYTKLGQEAFKVDDKIILKNYFLVPENIIEDIDELKKWVLEAVEVAKRNPTKSKKKKSAKSKNIK